MLQTVRTILEVVLVALLVVCATGFGLFFWNQNRIMNLHAETKQNAVAVPDSLRSGDFAGAQAQAEKVIASKVASPSDKAFVLANTAAIEYRMTADVRVLIPKIQALKKTVLDPAVEARTRADNLNAVMNFYEYSGEDPTVLKEIFAGNTYSSYWDEKSVALSFRNLAMWSMDINPTPRAAIQVATQNALYILESGLTTAKMAPYIQEAETYMVKADTLAANLLATVPKFKNTTRYIDYLFWKAFVLGTLAHVKGGDYKTQYIPAYETVLATIPTQKNVFAEPYTQIANWHYAVFLMAVDNNKALAQEKLKKASQGIAIATHPDFVHLIQNKKAGFLPPHSFLGDSLMTMAAISPEFKALIDGIK